MAWPLILLVAAALIGSVFAAVHHADVLAHRVGEPFGTLILSGAMTVIEVALIVSMTLSSKEANSGLARDAVFASVMIAGNGMVGLCLLIGSIRHHVVAFRVEGAGARRSPCSSRSPR
ncbi:MAG TPA: hypothetical protein VLW85_23710 [Myxococcales bacterium]|nr:hypothetical protein [Myxococcales bacterium]